MITTEQFIEKIEFLLNYYNLTASLFADKIGVQRSSLSHLMSGRNKPSLDFVVKIIEEFPEVDLYWFLFNQGEFPKKIKTQSTKDETSSKIEYKESEKNNFEIQQSREILPLDLFQSPIENDIKEKPQGQLVNDFKPNYDNQSRTNTYRNEIFEEEKKFPSIIENKNEEIKETVIEQNIPITNTILPTRNTSKIKKLLLIYEDGFFEEYNYR